jgi:hypothetical protein
VDSLPNYPFNNSLLEVMEVGELVDAAQVGFDPQESLTTLPYAAPSPETLLMQHFGSCLPTLTSACHGALPDIAVTWQADNI